MSDLENKYTQNQNRWIKPKLDDLMQETENLRKRLVQLQQLIDKENTKTIQNMVRRQARKDELKQRIGVRKSSTSRPQAFG